MAFLLVTYSSSIDAVRSSPHPTGYARQVVRELMAKAEVLNGLPCLGRVVPEIEQEQVREISLYAYRILYEITGDDIFILAVVHKRRELLAEQIGK